MNVEASETWKQREARLERERNEGRLALLKRARALRNLDDGDLIQVLGLIEHATPTSSGVVAKQLLHRLNDAQHWVHPVLQFVHDQWGNMMPAVVEDNRALHDIRQQVWGAVRRAVEGKP
jgi:hypothetical protein